MLDDATTLRKGMSLLERLGRPKRLSELAAETGIAKSTVHRLLTSLRYEGWIAQNSDSSYRRGWRWSTLTGDIAPLDDLNGQILGELERFRRATSSTMGFSYFRGSEMLCDMRLQGDHEHTVLPDEGQIVPFGDSATGRVILGALPDPQMFRLIEAERETQREMDLTQVLHHVRRTRATGVSSLMKRRRTGTSESGPLVTCWAAVVLDSHHYPIAAVSAARVGDFLPVHQNESGIRDLLELSRRITRMFGSEVYVTPPMRAGWQSVSMAESFGFPPAG